MSFNVRNIKILSIICRLLDIAALATLCSQEKAPEINTLIKTSSNGVPEFADFVSVAFLKKEIWLLQDQEN